MQWVERVTWSALGFLLHTRGRLGESGIRKISELPSVVCQPEDRAIKVRGATCFDAWRQLTDSEVAALQGELGFTGSSGCQAFYEFAYQGKACIVPAGVLMCSMFRPFAGMSKYTFAPQGLDNLCIPSGNEDRPEVLFFTNARSSTGMQPENAPGILNSLSWMHAFPSARRMWDSALDHARAGVLDLSLPKGSFSFYGRSSPAGDRLLLTELHLMLLRTEEDPFPGYSAHTRDIEFERVLHNEERVSGRTGKLSMKAALPSRAGCYTLDDDEWAQLSRIAVARKPQPRPMRQMVDCILVKLGTGIAWADATPAGMDHSGLPHLYSRLRADGRWDFLLGVLRQSRA